MKKRLDKLSAKERAVAEESISKVAKRFSGNQAVLKFVTEVLTEGERQTIGRRIAIAQLILRGKTYHEVNALLGVSPNTFRNVRAWLSHQLPEYGAVVTATKTKAELSGRKRQKQKHIRPEPFTFADLKRKYPAHFLIFNIIDGLLK